MDPSQERGATVLTRTPFIFYACVTFCAIASTLLGSAMHFLAALLVGAGGIYWFRAAARQPVHAHRFSEDAYLLGYIGTIAGLGAIAYRISLKPDLLATDNLTSILRDGALALLSTIFGLVAMNVIKTKGYVLDPGASDEAGVVGRPGPGGFPMPSAAAVEEMARLAGTLAEAARGAGLFRSGMQETLAAMQTFNSQVATLTSSAGTLAEATKTFGPVWQQLADTCQRTPDVAEQLGRSVKALEALGVALESILPPLEAQAEGFRLGNAEIKQQTTLLEANRGELARINGSLQTSSDALAHLANATSRAEAGLRSLGETGPATEILGQRVQAAAEAVETLHGWLTQTTAGLDGFATRLRETDETASRADKSLSELVGRVGQAMAILEDKIAQLQPLAPAVSELITRLNQAEQPLKAVTESFRDIQNIRSNLEGTVQYLTGFNAQITTAGASTKSLGDAVQNLQRGVEELVSRMGQRLHDLYGLSNPLKELCALAPKLDGVKPGIEQLGELVKHMDALSERFGALESGVRQVNTQLQAVPALITNFVDVTSQKIQEYFARSRR